MSNPRIKEKYLNEVVPALMEKFQYKSIMQVPKIAKVAINKGIGAATADKKLVDVGVDELTIISGQKAVPTIAKKSVSNFKLREGMPASAQLRLNFCSDNSTCGLKPLTQIYCFNDMEIKPSSSRINSDFNPCPIFVSIKP